MTIVENCLLSNIAVNPLNIRRDLGDLTELKASIAEQGILQPLIVAPSYQSGTETHGQPPFVLIDGERRLTAAREAGLERTTVIVRDDLLDQESQVEAMLVTALQRADLTPVEEAHAYTQLLAFDGVTAQTIAKATGRSIDTVKQRVKLTKLPERVQQQLHTQQVNLTDVMVIVEFAGDLDAVNELEHVLGTSAFTHTVARLRQRKEAAKREAKTRRDLAKAAVLIIDRPASYPWSSLEKPLYELRIAPEAHADCPGHAALIERSGEAEFLCTNPAEHHPKETDEAPSNALTPEEIAEQEAKEATKAALEIAEGMRTEWIQPYLTGGAKVPDKALALWLAIDAVDLQCDDDEIAKFFGWTPPADLDEDDADARVRWFLGQMLNATPGTINRLVMRRLVDSLEWDLKPNRDWSPIAQAFMAFLVDNGYPITPEEQAKAFPEPVAAVSDASA